MTKLVTAVLLGLLLVSPWAEAPTVEGAGFHAPSRQELQPRAWLPLVMRNFPPPATISRYVASADLIDSNVMYSLGCNRGQAAATNQDVIIILDFGYPAYDGGSNQYGAALLNYPNPFYSVAQLTDVFDAFLSGFYNCSPSGAHLTAAMGVNNYGSGVTREHGIAWAQAVNVVNAWIEQPPSFAAKLRAWGGIDAEMDWNSGAMTSARADGYRSVAGVGNYYVDFGTCESCPITSPCTSPGQVLSGYPINPNKPLWTCYDIWYASWGAAPAQPVPEIYLQSGLNTHQWHRLSQFSVAQYGAPIRFKGTLTQWNACVENQRTNPNACIYGSDRADITPSVGYLQFYDALLSDPLTSATTQTLWWSTDMSWEK